MSPTYGPNAGDWARMNARLEAAAQASVDPHLEPGEEALVIQPVRPKGGWASTLSFPRLAMTPAIVELPKSSALAVTPSRFLVVSYPYPTDDASELVITVPLDEVRDVRMAWALAAKEVSWTAGGTHYAVWVNPWMAKKISQALAVD